jgi:hypothetical protein
MEATGDYYVTNDKTVESWHCPLDVDFAHAIGEMRISRLHAVFAIHVFVKHWDM